VAPSEVIASGSRCKNAAPSIVPADKETKESKILERKARERVIVKTPMREPEEMRAVAAMIWSKLLDTRLF